MIVRTLFNLDNQFTLGEVEVKLLPGIPLLHIVGQPDAQIREFGLKLKSALRTCGLQWPQGHQIVVNLRPAHFRKSSGGVELAIALGFLALTGQLSDCVVEKMESSIVYGEVALNGRVYAPVDIGNVLRSNLGEILTGSSDAKIRDGKWLELSTLSDPETQLRKCHFDWNQFWQEPEFPDLELHPEAFHALWLAAHMRLNVLIAGPQGTGKSTWANALYPLGAPPDVREIGELQNMFGDSVLESRWRPREVPHHSTTPLAMIGGGIPLTPGVISRAHGGLLVMDEFLEFHPYVLEALREPLQNGYVEHARIGERSRFPSRFQLIATANLCPCGKLYPGKTSGCQQGLTRCRTVCARLSGPIMDRFDLLIFSHEWLKSGHGRPWSEAREIVKNLANFARERGPVPQKIPEWFGKLEHSHRRRQALLRVARGLADFDSSREIMPEHFAAADTMVNNPMRELRQLFA